MDLGFSNFLQQFSSLPFALTIILVLAVVFVNGWTDAPNAIATCVSTRCLSAKAAVMMAAVFNFFGVLIMTLVSSSVAANIFTMVDFDVVSTSASNPAMIALCAGLFSIVIWAVFAWYFGIPTSESHALIAGISGSAIAMGGIGGINLDSWALVGVGLILSTVLGFGSGFIFSKIITYLFRNTQRDKAERFFKGAQIGGGAAMAFMHGAQDGQKFLGVMLLGMVIVQGGGSGGQEFTGIPLWMIVLVSVVMGVGTSIGGYRIIKAVGMDMVKLRKHQGFAADLSATFCLLVATVGPGIPVSTTHTKTTSIMGVGASKRISAVNWNIVKEMVSAWVLTFPGCGLLAFGVTKLFVLIFA